MTVKQLKTILENCDDNAEVVLVEGCSTTELYYLSHCINVERQAEFGQVWFSKGMYAPELMAKNNELFAKEQAAQQTDG